MKGSHEPFDLHTTSLKCTLLRLRWKVYVEGPDWGLVRTEGDWSL